MCPGGSDPAACPMPDICMPMTIGIDGVVACPVSCPVHCPEDHMWCDGGVDANGCMMPNTCVPQPSKLAHNIESKNNRNKLCRIFS